jgi:hypothetical protein
MMRPRVSVSDSQTTSMVRIAIFKVYDFYAICHPSQICMGRMLGNIGVSKVSNMGHDTGESR